MNSTPSALTESILSWGSSRQVPETLPSKYQTGRTYAIIIDKRTIFNYSSTDYQEMIAKPYNPTPAAKSFLQRHDNLIPLLVEVSSNYACFFSGPVTLGLDLFTSIEEDYQVLFGEIIPAPGYDPYQAIAEMSQFSDWFVPLFLRSNGLLNFHLVI